MGVPFSRRFCFVNLFALYFLYFSNLRRSEIKRCKGRLFLPVSKYSDKAIIAETEKETVRKCHSRAGCLAWLARMGATCRAFLALFLFTCVLLASFYFILFLSFRSFLCPQLPGVTSLDISHYMHVLDRNWTSKTHQTL